ncbi:uncharacterized protein [Antennarius striatus]|uniref:uncharacterized protein isoform X2 n=1 Tax=Antennarius striatus TaxID=241820 RepID=UPI0035AE180D
MHLFTDGVEDTLIRSSTFHTLTQTSGHPEETGSPKLRRTTIASYMPQSKDQNGNFPGKDTNRQEAKPLGKLNTDEVCQWFTDVGMQKCVPSIRGAKLCGADIASVDENTLEILQITTMEDREQLLSAIYDELHPPTTVSQRIDSLLESLGPDDVETIASELASMSKSKSSPHVNRLSMNRQSLKLRNNNYMGQRNSQLIEITVNASDRIVHLRTPKETTIGKIIDSCIKMLGVTEDKSVFMCKERQGSSEEIQPDQQIGSLLTSASKNRQIELHLCKRELVGTGLPNNPEVDSSDGNSNKDVQVNQTAREERIRELNQQVDSLQNVILQVQELHHDLVAFCSELKNTDGDEVDMNSLDSVELTQRLELVKSRQINKRQSLQALRDGMNNSTAHKNQPLDIRLLQKIKMNCQVFKEEISLVHLNRQLAHLQNALQDSHVKEKAQKKNFTHGSLSQLVSLQSPAMLLVVQEKHNSDGQYGFTCLDREGSGLEVVEVDRSHLCMGDRLLEVNGVPVVDSSLAELTDILLQGSSAQIVVLRQPPPTLSSRQHPPLLQHMVSPEPMPTITPEEDVITMETPCQRKAIAI